MKNLLPFLLCITLLWCISGCRAPAEVEEVSEDAPADLSLSDEDIAAINALGPEFVKIVTEGLFDLDSLLELFTDDMVMIGPEIPAMEGKEAYRAWIEPLNVKMTEASFDFRDVGGSGDVAYVYMNYDESYTMEGQDAPIEDTGNVLAILQRQPDGSWLFSHWMWAPDKPLD